MSLENICRVCSCVALHLKAPPLCVCVCVCVYVCLCLCLSVCVYTAAYLLVMLISTHLVISQTFSHFSRCSSLARSTHLVNLSSPVLSRSLARSLILSRTHTHALPLLSGGVSLYIQAWCYTVVNALAFGPPIYGLLARWCVHYAEFESEWH